MSQPSPAQHTEAIEIELISASRPQLESGSYRLLVQQSVKVENQEHHYYQEQALLIQGPRYFLAAEDLYARYPPEGASGKFGEVLPHVVLRKRALPWERTVGEGAPWLALLVMTQKEFEALGGESLLEECTTSVLRSLPSGASASQWLLPELSPALPGEDESQPLQVLNLPWRSFKKFCPKLENLRYLAHVRKIGMSHKVPLEMHAPGEFAVIVAHRLPREGLHRVFLVSLEGWEALLRDPAPSLKPEAKARVVCLAQWSFCNLMQERHHFKEFLGQLHLQTLSLPAPSNPVLRTYFEQGYVPLKGQPGAQNSGVAWFRGPLMPLEPSPQEPSPLLLNAEAALSQEAQSGLAQVSYASAWQIGHLLALSAPGFLRELRHFFSASLHVSEMAWRLQSYIDLHQVAFEETPAPVETATRQQVFAVHSLIEWLARLMLLYPLPFQYLVPEERLLPRESLRFFYLDPQWIEALLAGTLCAGMQKISKARFWSKAQTLPAWQELQALIARLLSDYRPQLLGLQAVKVTTNEALQQKPFDYRQQPISGFLMRSALLTGWPGLEIKPYCASASRPQDLEEAQILRLDQVNEDIMLCLVAGHLKRITFHEPKESLSFQLMAQTTPVAGWTLGSHKLKSKVFPAALVDSEGYLDLQMLVKQLQPLEATPLHSAHIAVHLMAQSQTVQIDWDF